MGIPNGVSPCYATCLPHEELLKAFFRRISMPHCLILVVVIDLCYHPKVTEPFRPLRGADSFIKLNFLMLFVSKVLPFLQWKLILYILNLCFCSPISHNPSPVTGVKKTNSQLKTTNIAAHLPIIVC